MKILVATLLLVPLLFSLSGCETFRGFGRDMQRAGKSIERVGNR